MNRQTSWRPKDDARLHILHQRDLRSQRFRAGHLYSCDDTVDNDLIRMQLQTYFKFKVLKIPMYFTVAWEENRLKVNPSHR